MPRQPTIYEINTPIFLSELSDKYKQRVTLATVSDQEWDKVAALPIDAVWLMGVWERSPVARRLAHKDPYLKIVLPDLTEADIIGSAYSIHNYTVDQMLGGDAGLAVARAKLRSKGIALILDFVPNHVAIDHPWTLQHPDYFLHGTERQLAQHPNAFVERPTGILAKGKDPNFEPWSDVLQLNAYSPGLRKAVIQTLQKMSDMCDGVRCDMAMLMMNDIFRKTWGKRAGTKPATDYWPTVIQAVKQHNPSFIFLAEAYWDKESALLEQGFDLCYDKKIYDALTASSVQRLRKLLRQPRDYQEHLMRFIENHDEPRAAVTFDAPRHAAAAVIMATIPGAHLYHQGQFAGKTKHLPVHLCRGPKENASTQWQEFYHALLTTARAMSLPQGTWQRCPVRRSYAPLLSPKIMAWQWRTPSGNYLALINYSPTNAKGRLRINAATYGEQILGSGSAPGMTQLLGGKTIELKPWQYSIIRMAKPRTK